MARCYHVELKSFPHVARAFNLDRATLEGRFLEPFAAGRAIAFGDRRWSAERTKLTVFEGRPVSDAARGLGRGWGEVTRHGQEVTEAVLAEMRRHSGARPDVESLQAAVAEVAARPEGIDLSDVVALAAAAQPGRRASDQLALAEQAVWELLHRRRLEMLDADGAAVPAERWEAFVLSWAQRAGGTEPPVRLRAVPETGAG
ncbi:MAG TPA: hypothetical protein VKV21_15600 [Solirubrobacteraceae bacterium]|nr:hypothetical protein [Solirubrobacteraceae bacterium]